jgi:hypothetical protein
MVGRVAMPAVRPIPAITGHTLNPDLTSPPTTAECEAMYQIACYEPAQFHQAYDLEALYNEGLTGAGETKSSSTLSGHRP